MRDAPWASARRRRRGISTVELLLVLPVFLAMLLGMLEFSAIFAARQRLLAASREGARVAALGGSGLEIEAAVNRMLGPGWASEASIGDDAEAGDVDLDALSSGEPVAVRVHVPAIAVAPDVLRFVGLGLGDHEIVAVTTMIKE